MANFRQIHVSIWKDPWFLELEPEEKLLFIYLFSNESTSLSGIYEISIRVISFETGLSIDFVNKALQMFADHGKVKYQDGVMWVINLRKYNASSSDKVLIRIQNDIDSIPANPIKDEYIAYYQPKIPYPYPNDTLSHEEEEEEENNRNSRGNEVAAAASSFHDHAIIKQRGYTKR